MLPFFKVDLQGVNFPHLTFDSLTSHDLTETTYLLDDDLVLGYPPIPFTVMPNQLAMIAQVNAVVNVRHFDFPHYVVSSLARGGYSGGPVITQCGKVISIITESLVENNKPSESGFMSVLSAEAVLTEVKKYFEYNLEQHNIYWEFDPRVSIKFYNKYKDTNKLNTKIVHAEIEVVDIDPDACGHILCDDPLVLKKASRLLEEICSIERWEVHCDNKTFCF